MKETPHSLNTSGNADDTNRVPCPPSQGTRETDVTELLAAQEKLEIEELVKVAEEFEGGAMEAFMRLQEAKRYLRIAMFTYRDCKAIAAFEIGRALAVLNIALKRTELLEAQPPKE